MNRETFMHNVDISDTDIIAAFENLMALYCLYSSTSVGEYENIKISKTSSELASFDLILDNAVTAYRIFESLNGLHIKLYDKLYDINCEVDDNIVHIVMEK